MNIYFTLKKLQTLQPTGGRKELLFRFLYLLINQISVCTHLKFNKREFLMKFITILICVFPLRQFVLLSPSLITSSFIQSKKGCLGQQQKKLYCPKKALLLLLYLSTLLHVCEMAEITPLAEYKLSTHWLRKYCVWYSELMLWAIQMESKRRRSWKRLVKIRKSWVQQQQFQCSNSILNGMFHSSSPSYIRANGVYVSMDFMEYMWSILKSNSSVKDHPNLIEILWLLSISVDTEMSGGSVCAWWYRNNFRFSLSAFACA